MELHELMAHIEIRQALVRYCRGVDRSDEAMIRSAFHEDATDEHGAFKGTGWEMASAMCMAERDMADVGSHNVTNVYVEFDSADRARVESYVLAFHPYRATSGVATPDAETKMGIFAGRYEDIFERRDGEWKIAKRVVIGDWSRAEFPGAHWPRGSWQEGGFPRGGRGDNDPSQSLFPGEKIPG
jgi:hypothetical protein